MALFVVNRFVGDDSVLNSKNEDGFRKLLEKIEERRKSKDRKSVKGSESNSDLSPLKNENDFQGEVKSKKEVNKSLFKLDFDKNEENKPMNVSSLEDEGTAIKKVKKKRKSSGSCFDEADGRGVKKMKNENLSGNDATDSVSLDLEENLSDKKKSLFKSKKESNEGSLPGSEVDTEVSYTKRKRIDSNAESIGERNDVENDSIVSEKNENDEPSEFTVIGGHNFKRNRSVKWVPPEWLSKVISVNGTLGDKTVPIESIKFLDDILIENLKRNNIKYFFPVQRQVIPWVLSQTRYSGPGLRFWPRDICVSAPTGSGKTLAFVLPIIQLLRKRLIRRIGALVVVPVQDLAAQVAQVFRQYTIGTGLQVLSVTGKKIPLQQEQKLLVYKKAGVGYESLIDIMVTTPGRLVEHLKETPGFSLRHLKFLVIDEADRVIDNIKSDWLYHLEKHISSGGSGAPLSVSSLLRLPVRPQKLLFSATLTHDPEKLKEINLFQPRLFMCNSHMESDNIGMDKGDLTNREVAVDVSFGNQLMKPSELDEFCIECSTELKPLILYYILAEKKWRGVLCFTHFTDATHRLTCLLRHLSSCHGLNLRIEEISSERSFNDRHVILNNFRAGNIDVLVCTDVYSRGMDILEVRFVVLYSPPVHIQNYVHQVGRTARAGQKGTALTLLTPSQVKPFNKMLNKNSMNSKLTELKVTEKDLLFLEKPYKKALRLLKKEAINEKESSKERTKVTKRKNFIQHNRGVVNRRKKGLKNTKFDISKQKKHKSKRLLEK